MQTKKPGTFLKYKEVGTCMLCVAAASSRSTVFALQADPSGGYETHPKTSSESNASSKVLNPSTKVEMSLKRERPV